ARSLKPVRGPVQPHLACEAARLGTPVVQAEEALEGEQQGRHAAERQQQLRAPGGDPRGGYFTPWHFAHTSRSRPSSMSFFRCLRVSLFQMASMPVAKTLAVFVRPS